MHIDRFIAQNQPVWDRLDALTKRARRNPADLSPAELDELIQLYQRTSSHLSHARTYYGDPTLTARLTALVATSRSVIYGKRPRTLAAVGDFFRFTFPAAVWMIRRAVLAAALLLAIPVVVMIVWLTNNPEAMEASGSAAERQQVVDESFESYYSENPSAQFAATVGFNNIWVSFLAFALGCFFVVGGAFVLVSNGMHIGTVGAWLTEAGEGPLFWTLIAPHGLLEITSIVLAGAAGLHVGWSLIAPGDRRRSVAIAEEGRRAGAVVLGLVLFFAVAALIEGFVTGSALPIQAKVGIGVLAWAAFVLYVVVLGRAAVDLGHTGALGQLDRGWSEVRRAEAPRRSVVVTSGPVS